MAALCRTEAGELFAEAGYNGVSRVFDYQWKICFRDLSESVTVEEGAAAAAPIDTPNADPDGLKLLQFAYPYADSCHIPGKLTATQLKGRIQDREVSDGADAIGRRSAFSFRKPVFLDPTMTAAERGTATHLFLQFANYSACVDEMALDRELQRLVDEKFITPDQAKSVERGHILYFFRSELGQWLRTRKVKREFKFSLLVNAKDYGLGSTEDQVLLQGVVDCFAIEEDGLTILDFKTDRTPRPEHYRPQLDAYADALSRIYELPVKKKILYFFATDEAVYL